MNTTGRSDNNLPTAEDAAFAGGDDQSRADAGSDVINQKRSR